MTGLLTNPESRLMKSQGQNIFFYGNHPIRWVRLVGVIVALDVLPSRFIIALDDSSGATIDVTCERPKSTLPTSSKASDRGISAVEGPKAAYTNATTQTGRDIDLAGFDVGSIAKVKGAIGAFRGERQILLERIVHVSATNEEAAAWGEVSTFHESVLNRPWIVSEQNLRRARRKAERGHIRGQTKRDGARRNTDSRKRAERDSKGDAHKRTEKSSVEVEAQKEKALEQRQLEKRKRQEHLDQKKMENEIEKGRAEEALKQECERRESELERAAEQGRRPEKVQDTDQEQRRRRREADRAERERIFAERERSSKDLAKAPMTKQTRKQRRTDYF